MDKEKISVLIITKNEANNLNELLPTLAFADEIVIVDSFSTDKTVEVAKKHTNKIFQRKFDNHANQKNWGLTKTINNWVFIIDADERVNDKLIKELIEKVHNPKNKVAFWIKRTNIFMDKAIHYSGWQSDKVIRLINKNYCKYNTAIIHEEIIANGNIGKLQNTLQHNTYKNLSDYLNKINDYTNKKALIRFNKGKNVTYFSILFKPFIKFLSRYFIKLGILDGKQGLIVCLLTSYNVFLTNIKIYRLSNGEELQ